MQYTTDGLVIREVPVGENDKMLTLLTPDRGRIGVMAKGARSVKSRVLAGVQLYTYGNYEIYEKSDYKWLRGGSLIEGFFGLRDDIERLSLAEYLADVACDLTGEDYPSVEMLRMTLNAFYAISQNKKPMPIIKGVYELRAAGFSGFMPELSECRRCHKKDVGRSYLDVANGCVICSECVSHGGVDIRPLTIGNPDEREERSLLLPMSGSVLAAVRYALAATPERIFSFSLEGKDETDMFAKVAEEYLLFHLERGFSSLEFYKSLAAIETQS